MTPPTTIDSVSGLNLLGGIPRMTDDNDGAESQSIQVDSPKTVECIARAKWYSKFKSDAANSAKFIGRRSKQTTHTSYMPATNPKFSQHVRTMTMSITTPSSSADEQVPAAASAAAVDINAVQATVLVRGLQSMRIRLIVDPVPMTIVELRALCAKTSRIEALAYMTYVDDGEDDDTLLAEYNFVKQTRIDLEIEIQRCQRHPPARNAANAANAANPTPTPHARIAPFHRTMLRNVLSPDTLKRAFVSVPALTVAVGNDIERFLTWECHAPDRIAVVGQIRAALILAASSASSAAEMNTNTNTKH